MKALSVALRTLGMAFVVLTTLNSLRHLALVSEVTETLVPLILGIPVCAGLIYWAYRVIWLPIKQAPP